MRVSRLARNLLSAPLGFYLAFSPAAAQTKAPASKPLTDMVAAIGGDAFLRTREIHTTGRFYSFKRGELVSADLFADYIKLPEMERTEFGSQKAKTVSINNGDIGWTIEGKDGKEITPQSPTQTKEFSADFKTSFDYVTRFVLGSPQTTVQDLGSDVIDLKRVDVVEVRDSAKNLIRFYIDRESHLPLKMQVRHANQSSIREEQYGNWHKFDGIMTALFIGRFKDGVKQMEIRLESADYDSGLAESLFTPPAGK